MFLFSSAIPVFAVLMTTYKLTIRFGSVIPAFVINQLFGLFMPYISLQIPFLTLVFVGGLKSIPLELEEAAIIDGCGLLDVIFRIVLPAAAPVFFTAFVLNFLGIWNEYPVASVLLTTNERYTIPLAISFFKSTYSADYGAMLRAVIIILIPQTIFYLIFQRRIVEGMITSGIKQ
jgi:raffinose/stachyose/melibiose transport system permease protein